MLLEDRRVLVTGASRGIGRAIALACAREGAAVGINYHRSEEQAAAVRREIGERFGRSAELLPFDVSDAEAVERQVGAFAGPGLDVLINNAAVPLPGLLPTVSPEAIRRTLEVDLLGAILCARAALPAMLAARRGTILAIGSAAAARPARGQAVYAAAKGALIAFTRALAVEYGRKGIRAAVVVPGPIDTAMLEPTLQLAGDEVRARVPLARLGTAEEVAEMVVFLASERASFVSGAAISVDGGYSCG